MATSSPHAARMQQLEPGAQLAFAVTRGTEVFCAAGSVELTAMQPWIGDAPCIQPLRAGQGWRAAEGTRVALVARQPSRVRIVPAPR